MPFRRGNNLCFLTAKDARDLSQTYTVSQYRTVYGLVEDTERRIHMAASAGAHDLLYDIPVYMNSLPMYNPLVIKPVLIDHFRRQGYVVIDDMPNMARTQFYLNWGNRQRVPNSAYVVPKARKVSFHR